MPLVVNVVAVATPLAFVVPVADTPPPGKVPLGPFDGTVNVTLTFGTGLPLASVTIASSGVGSAVSTSER